MKAVIIFSLVLVACMHLQADAMVIFGQTDDCRKEPAGYENTCHKYVCDEDTGFWTVHTCAGYVSTCPEGQVAVGPKVVDFSKSYPDCCPKFLCRVPN